VFGVKVVTKLDVEEEFGSGKGVEGEGVIRGQGKWGK